MRILMKKTIVEIYALFVCFISLIWFTFALVWCINESLVVLLPKVMILPITEYNEPYQAYQTTNESTQKKATEKQKTAEEKKAALEERNKEHFERAKQVAIKDIISSIVSLIVSALIF